MAPDQTLTRYRDKSRPILKADRDQILEYNKQDSLFTLRLKNHFQRKASREEWNFITEIEMPFILSIFHMNWHGIPFDIAKAEALCDELTGLKLTIEKDIFAGVGRTFNVGSHRDLRQALFYNANLSYKSADGSMRPIYPPAATENAQSKVDLSTLSEIKSRIVQSDPASPTVVTINNIMQWLEIEKGLAWIASCLRVTVQTAQGTKIFPQLKAEAKSGRVTCKKPALIAMPKKIFGKSDTSGWPSTQKALAENSIKKLFAIDSPSICQSVDISGLDLTVMAHLARKFNKNFPWVEFMVKGGDIDTHMCIYQSTDFDNFMDEYDRGKISSQHLAKILREHFPLKLKDESKIEFIHKRNDKTITLYANDEESRRFAVTNIKNIRGTWKVVNLSIPYFTGAKSLALKFKKDTGQDMSVLEAERLLTKFKENVPEIGKSQDWLANKIYKVGCEKSVFGRRFYADVFDELNEYYWSCRRTKTKGTYKFICYFENDYWYVEASNWLKADFPIIKNAKVTDKKAVLRFENIECAVKLSKFIFRKPDSIRKKSKFSRKSEDNLDEFSNFQLTRIQITNEVMRSLRGGTSVSMDAREIFSTLIYEGNYFLPEKSVVFFGVPTNSPSSDYFRFYKPLEKVARKFYPVFCQGIANVLAQMCLTEVRREIESKNLDASILLFVHDQIDVMLNEAVAPTIKSLLLNSIASAKKGFNRAFDIRLSGEAKEPVHHLPTD